MKLFSGLFGKKITAPTGLEPQTKDIKPDPETPPDSPETPPNNSTPLFTDSVKDIASKLASYSQTANVAKELMLLSETPNTPQPDYLRILEALKITLQNEQAKSAVYRQLLGMMTDIQLISSAKFDATFKAFEKFYEDFPHLTAEFTVLDRLAKLFPSAFAEGELADLLESYSVLSPAFEVATEQGKILEQEQAVLTEEILKFTATVNDFSQKYRTSPDWEGKKQPMIALSKKLTERRDPLVAREETLCEELKLLYSGYPELHQSFANHSKKFLTLLQQKTDSLAGETYIDKELGVLVAQLSNVLTEML